MAIIWFVLLAPEMQHHSAVVRPPALPRQRRAAGSKQFLIARPAQLFAAFQKWHCSSRGATAGPVHRRGSLCCHAGLLGAENVAACLSSLSSELPRGPVRARRCADTAALLPVPQLALDGDPSAALHCRV